jgi:hypothetical protein
VRGWCDTRRLVTQQKWSIYLNSSHFGRFGKATASETDSAQPVRRQGSIARWRLRGQGNPAGNGVAPSSQHLPLESSAHNFGLQQGEPAVEGPGTWAGRRQVFDKKTDGQNGPAVAVAAAREAQQRGGVESPKQLRGFCPTEIDRREPGNPAAIDDDAELHQAWRWRFGRKWQMEQARQFDPENTEENEDDEWGAALGYLGTAGDGLNLQLGRSESLEPSASLRSPSLGHSMSIMLDNSSIKEVRDSYPYSFSFWARYCSHMPFKECTENSFACC